jgi:predicted transcriptional regulator
MKVLQEIEFLDQEGFVEMKKKPWPGHVTITDLGRDKLRKAHS